MTISPGLAIIHANKLEDLRTLLVDWIGNNPLAPLENETLLVQSSGMGQWLKLGFAAPEGLGICAAVSVQLPAQFLWHTYQFVLGTLPIAEDSLFDRDILTWRLFRLLPGLMADSRFASLKGFMNDDTDARKRYQLATHLAGLFDQYQVYRADWLTEWAEQHHQLRDANGTPYTLEGDQIWQALLWRALLDDLPKKIGFVSRAALHDAFLNRLASLKACPNQRPQGLPRRIVVFGISSLPRQTLDALTALSRFSQVLMFVHNPCRHYWADIIEHRELLLATRKRQAYKPGMQADLADEDLHLHANPLLASWGKQGRDYIRLLDHFDEPDTYRDRFQRIDVFEDFAKGDHPSLLSQVQQAILDLEPLPATADQRIMQTADDSIVFHIAHSPQREVEILHDQLLAWFDQYRNDDRPLQPRDVIVMVPDINAYAPSIRAVFGQIPRDDARYLPYSLADQRERSLDPLLNTVEALLHIGESRFTLTELLDWLGIPALRARFKLDEADVPLLRRWVEQAGVRWGLHSEHRGSLDLPATLEQNSWHFGMQRMLLGYAVGAGDSFMAIEPHDEVGGLEAHLVGTLKSFLDALDKLWRELAQPALPSEWGKRFHELLDTFFQPEEPADIVTLQKARDSLVLWLEQCEQAEVVENLPLVVAREAWLQALEDSSGLQHFLTGGINFCTLMPMRAIPFRVVCLLGMSDGEYPRGRQPPSFDLMNLPGQYRPGDRSRREDDRYLFLEALLSVREHLLISWVGRSIRDNSHLPPSLLVGQLRDYLASGWRAATPTEPELKQSHDPGEILLNRITVEHPLQPFSSTYFLNTDAPDHDPRLYTYATEWRLAHNTPQVRKTTAITLPAENRQTPLTLDTLTAFWRYPVKHFFTERLKIRLETTASHLEDGEPFQLDKLDIHIYADALLQAALHQVDPAVAEQALEQEMAKLRLKGTLPFAGFADQVQKKLLLIARKTYQRAAALQNEWPKEITDPMPIVFAPDNLPMLEDWLTSLRSSADGHTYAQIVISPGAVMDKNKPRWHKLNRLWITHLAGCACGIELNSYLVGVDNTITLQPLPKVRAECHLSWLIKAWYSGIQSPLPVDCKTAFAWLSDIKANTPRESAATQKTYEGQGDDFNKGQVQYDSYLQRAYPDFESLIGPDEAAGFSLWTECLYRPLYEHLTA